MNAETENELLWFFRALADPTRLQVAGQLARRAQTMAELGVALGLKPVVLMKHLSMLEHVGFVRQASGKYHWRLDAIHALAARVSDAPAAPEVPEGTLEYDRAVLSAFLNTDGTLKEIPAQEKKQEVFFRHLFALFETGREYTEKEVNEIIRRVHEDTAYFRRGLIDRGWLQREVDGRRYWRAA